MIFKVHLKRNLLMLNLGGWGLGIGDWGLGIGDWPNPQSPIPNPHSPIPNPPKISKNVKKCKMIPTQQYYFKYKIYKFRFFPNKLFNKFSLSFFVQIT